MWLSLVERCVRDAEVAGSSPVTSIKKALAFSQVFFNIQADAEGLVCNQCTECIVCNPDIVGYGITHSVRAFRRLDNIQHFVLIPYTLRVRIYSPKD